VFVCLSENLSPHPSQDDFDNSEQQQQQQQLASPLDDNNDDDDDINDDGSADRSWHETEIGHDENVHHHHDHHYRGDRVPAAESHGRRHDAAVQVDDLARRSSSTQASWHYYQSAF